jgi:hypothetical protein
MRSSIFDFLKKGEQFCDEMHTCIAFDLEISAATKRNSDSCRLYATIVNARTGSSAPSGRTWCSKTTATMSTSLSCINLKSDDGEYFKRRERASRIWKAL